MGWLVHCEAVRLGCHNWVRPHVFHIVLFLCPAHPCTGAHLLGGRSGGRHQVPRHAMAVRGGGVETGDLAAAVRAGCGGMLLLLCVLACTR